MMLIIGLPILLAACLWLWPLARRWLRGSPGFEPLAFFAGLGLSLGALSLIMMWLGLLPGAWMRAWFVLPIPWFVLFISMWIDREEIKATLNRIRSWPRPRGMNWRWWLDGEAVPLWLSLIAAGVMIVITINLVSYPFYTYDVLARYAPNAREIFTLGHIPSTLFGYPLGAQLLYAFGFMAAGAVNDHLAGLLSVALVFGFLGATWAVTRLLFSTRAAWAAVVFTLGAPLFINWSTSAYVDIPEGFFRGLTFALAYLWLTRGEVRYAVLAGVLGGLAIWVKHSSIVVIPALGVVPLLRLLPWSWPRLRREAGLGILSLGLLGLLVGPWFLRSYLLAGSGGVFPAPSTYDALQVDRSLDALIVFWQRRDQWGWALAIAALIGMVLWAASFVWPRLSRLTGADGDLRRTILLWAAFVIPYHLLWWWGFSYGDSRYLFASWPMYLAVAGFAADWALSRLPFPNRIPAFAAVVVAVILVSFSLYPRLGAVYYLVTDPLQTDDVKLTRRATDHWLVVKQLRETALPGAKVFAVDGALAYWLYDYDLRIGFAVRAEELRDYDYYIDAQWRNKVFRALGNSTDDFNHSLDDPALFTKLYTSGSSEAAQTLYAVKNSP